MPPAPSTNAAVKDPLVAATEPLVAAIDIGSNAIRLAVAACTPDAAPRLVHFRREPVRLGESVFLTGFADEETVRRAVEAADSFREDLEARGAVAVRAVATQALRTAINGADVISRLARALGHPIELITADEEARLVRLAATSRLGPAANAAEPVFDLIIDLGGGSSQWSLTRGSEVAWSGHFPIGAVRLRNALRQVENPDTTLREWTQAPLDDLRSSLERMDRKASLRLIFVGGNAESLADLAGCTPALDPPRPLSINEIRAIVARVREIEPERREPELGLPPNRGDVLLPATLLFLEIMNRLKIEEAWIPRTGLKEGILQEMQERVLKTWNPETRPAIAEHLAEIVRRSSRRFCRRLADLRSEPNEKNIHGIRVAARRLLAVLDLVEGALKPLRVTEEARQRVREVRRALATARDLQAARARLADLAVSGLPARVAQRLLSDRLDRAIEEVRRYGGRGRARDAEARLRPVREALKALSRRPGVQDAIATACAERLRSLRTVLLEAVELLDDEDPASIHALRVALKKYRYAAEALEPLLTREAGDELPALAALQEELGAVQDLETLRQILGELIGGEDDPSGLHAATWNAVLREQEERMALASELVEAHEWREWDRLLVAETPRKFAHSGRTQTENQSLSAKRRASGRRGRKKVLPGHTTQKNGKKSAALRKKRTRKVDGKTPPASTGSSRSRTPKSGTRARKRTPARGPGSGL